LMLGLILGINATGMEKKHEEPWHVTSLPLQSCIEIADKQFMQPIYNPSTKLIYFTTFLSKDVCKRDPITIQAPCLDFPKDYTAKYVKYPSDVNIQGIATVNKQEFIVPLLATTYVPQDTLFINYIDIGVDTDKRYGNHEVRRNWVVRDGRIADISLFLYPSKKTLLATFYLTRTVTDTGNTTLTREQLEFDANNKLTFLSHCAIKEFVEKFEK
jgi:hypothetical protein